MTITCRRKRSPSLCDPRAWLTTRRPRGQRGLLRCLGRSRLSRTCLELLRRDALHVSEHPRARVIEQHLNLAKIGPDHGKGVRRGIRGTDVAGIAAGAVDLGITRRLVPRSLGRVVLIRGRAPPSTQRLEEINLHLDEPGVGSGDLRIERYQRLLGGEHIEVAR